MKPFIKWSGSLESELDMLLPLFPNEINNYFEPFVGSGTCYFAVEANKYFINDICEELMDLYKILSGSNQKMMRDFKRMVKAWENMDIFYDEHKNELQELKFWYDIGRYKIFLTFAEAVKEFAHKCKYDKIFEKAWTEEYEFYIELTHSIIQCIESMEKNSPDKEMVLGDLKTSVKEALYNYIQEIYNKFTTKPSLKSAAFMFLMNYAHKSKFIFDDIKEFRVEYGGKRLNNASLKEVVDMIESEEFRIKLARTGICCMDFIRFLSHKKPKKGDFIFINPPEKGRYDVYGNHHFSEDDYLRLTIYLLSEVKANWMLVSKKTDSLLKQYLDKGLFIKEIKGLKNYLIITNYTVVWI